MLKEERGGGEGKGERREGEERGGSCRDREQIEAGFFWNDFV